MRGRDVSGGVAAAAAATAVGGAAGEDGGQERGAPAGLGGAGPGAAEELSPSVWWKRTTVSGEEKPLHTLGSPGEGRKESRGLGGSSHSWCSSQGSALLPGMRGSHSRPPIGAAPLFPFLYLPCPPFASCLLWFQSRLQNTKLLLTFILQAFHHS